MQTLSGEELRDVVEGLASYGYWRMLGDLASMENFSAAGCHLHSTIPEIPVELLGILLDKGAPVDARHPFSGASLLDEVRTELLCSCFSLVPKAQFRKEQALVRTLPRV